MLTGCSRDNGSSCTKPIAHSSHFSPPMPADGMFGEDWIYFLHHAACHASMKKKEKESSEDFMQGPPPSCQPISKYKFIGKILSLLHNQTCHCKAAILTKLLTCSTCLNLLKLARFNKLTQLKQSGANLASRCISQWPCRTGGCLGRHPTGCNCRECTSLEDLPTYSPRTHYTVAHRIQS